MELKEKMNSLERFLEEDVAGKKQHGVDENNKKDPEDGLFGAGSEEEETSNGGSLPVPDDEKDLEPTPLAVQDAAYEDEADDEMYDLGFRVGKMRMNERVGGFFRPKLADEVSILNLYSVGIGGCCILHPLQKASLFTYMFPSNLITSYHGLSQHWT